MVQSAGHLAVPVRPPAACYREQTFSRAPTSAFASFRACFAGICSCAFASLTRSGGSLQVARQL
jgi:hypothetical protein